MSQPVDVAARINGWTEKIIGACIEIHRELGPGLLESAYEECLCYELGRLALQCARQEPLPVIYKGVRLDCGYRMDVVVEDAIILEIKTVERLLPIHEAQLLTYLKLTGLSLGLLLNFTGLTRWVALCHSERSEESGGERIGVETDSSLRSE